MTVRLSRWGALAFPHRSLGVAAALPALAAITFGVCIIFVVGFLQQPVAHNAAHDTRHANGFPCH